MNARFGIYQGADEPCTEIDLAPTSFVIKEVDTMLANWVDFKATTQSLAIMEGPNESKVFKCAWAIARLTPHSLLFIP